MDEDGHAISTHYYCKTARCRFFRSDDHYSAAVISQKFAIFLQSSSDWHAFRFFAFRYTFLASDSLRFFLATGLRTSIHNTQHTTLDYDDYTVLFRPPSSSSSSSFFPHARRFRPAGGDSKHPSCPLLIGSTLCQLSVEWRRRGGGDISQEEELGAACVHAHTH